MSLIKAKQNRKGTPTKTSGTAERKPKQKEGTTSETNNPIRSILIPFSPFSFLESPHRRNAVLFFASPA